jgi:hypothetical protein
MRTLTRLAASVPRNLARQTSPCAFPHSDQLVRPSPASRRARAVNCLESGRGSLDSAASAHDHAVSLARLATRPKQRGYRYRRSTTAWWRAHDKSKCQQPDRGTSTIDG